jgi:predicted AlkP superfamily phosphohydrolase/phosphomutase
MRTGRVVVVGIDGGTLDLIEPWAKDGHLPTFERLMRQGTWGELQSTFPPLTCPAWYSFSTGMNPGKLGMFNFFCLEPSSYRVRMFDYSDLDGVPELWDLLGSRGYASGIVNNPIAYPPREISGYMVAGFRAPSKRHQYAWPPQMRERLDEIAGGYEIDVPTRGNLGQILAAALRVMSKRQKVFLHLLRHDPTDFFLGVFTATDRVCHHFLNRSAQEMLPLFRALDANLATIWEVLTPEDRLLVMSDHGFGPRRKGLYINQWLIDKGYLRLKPGRDRVERFGLTVKNLRDARDRFGLRDNVLAARALGFLNRFLPFGSLEGKGQSILDLIKRDRIDWRQTRAVAIPDGIYLNTEDRPLGIVPRGNAVHALRREIREGLEQIEHPDLNRRLEVRTYAPEELYWGSRVDSAPDILWSIEDWSWGTIWNIPEAGGWYGELDLAHHRPNGLFMAAGPGIPAGSRINGVRITDLAPTILHWMGVPIPEQMDGRPVREIVSSAQESWGSLDAIPATSVPGEDPQSIGTAEEAGVWERLRGLGYLD